jgi:hypothetical protein
MSAEASLKASGSTKRCEKPANPLKKSKPFPVYDGSGQGGFMEKVKTRVLLGCALKDPAWRVQAWQELQSVALRAKSGLKNVMGMALAGVMTLALMFALLVACQAVGAVAYGWLDRWGEPTKMAQLTLDSSELAAWEKAQSRWLALTGHRGALDGLEQVKASGQSAQVFITQDEFMHWTKSLKEELSKPDEQASQDEAEALRAWIKATQAGASPEEAALALRQGGAAGATLRALKVVQRRFDEAPRVEMGTWEIIKAPWRGDRGSRDEAVWEQTYWLPLMAGVLSMAVMGLIGAAAWEAARTFRVKLEANMERHRERLESQIEARSIEDACEAPQAEQGKARPRL